MLPPGGDEENNAIAPGRGKQREKTEQSLGRRSEEEEDGNPAAEAEGPTIGNLAPEKKWRKTCLRCFSPCCWCWCLPPFTVSFYLLCA